MVDPAALLVLGMDRQELTAIAGAIGGLAFTLFVLAMTWLSVAPAYSGRWAENLGSVDPAGGGPDPAEVIPGRGHPIHAPSTRSAASAEEPAGALADASESAGESGEPDDAAVADGGGSD